MCSRSAESISRLITLQRPFLPVKGLDMSVEPVRRWCVGNVLFGKFWSLEIFLANFWKTLEVLSNFLETFETLKNFKKIKKKSLGNSLEAFRPNRVTKIWKCVQAK